MRFRFVSKDKNCPVVESLEAAEEVLKDTLEGGEPDKAKVKEALEAVKEAKDVAEEKAEEHAEKKDIEEDNEKEKEEDKNKEDPSGAVDTEDKELEVPTDNKNVLEEITDLVEDVIKSSEELLSEVKDNIIDTNSVKKLNQSLIKGLTYEVKITLDKNDEYVADEDAAKEQGYAGTYDGQWFKVIKENEDGTIDIELKDGEKRGSVDKTTLHWFN